VDVRKRWLLIPAAALALAAAGAAGGYAYDASRSDVLAEGVRVGGLDVGGLSAAEARAALHRRVQPRIDRAVVVRGAGRRVALAPAVSHVRLDVAGMVASALDRSRQGSLVHRVARDLRGRPLRVHVPLRVTYSRAAVTALVARIGKRIDRAPHDASVEPSVSAITTHPSRPGRAVRRQALARAIEAQLVRPGAPHVVAIPTRVVKPKVSTADLPRAYAYFITVDRAHTQLHLFEHLRLVKTYTIAVGRIGLETPAGLYHIQSKVVDPAWNVPRSAWAGSLAGQVIPPGSPDNPLKARWMGIYNGAGIHGTDDIGSLGSAASHGCIRMSVPDVEQLYSIVPLHTPVYIS
jgi:lipoprotein-anchoring transpeptidase ErfK/SrfK